MMRSIAVAIVSYNTREHLRACLASVMPEAPASVVVVDNGSRDGSVDMVQIEFPSVRLYQPHRNIGYGAAANLAITKTTADYIVLLNSDTRLHPGAIHALGTYLEQHPAVAIVGPRLENLDGTLQPTCYSYPTPLQIFLEESMVGRLARYIPVVRERYLRTWRHDRPRAVAWVLGAALAIRRSAFLAAGGFDEAFHMYYEEVDLCYRLHASGWQVHFTPSASIVHVGGASTRQLRPHMLRALFESMALFYRLHYSALMLARLVVVVKTIMLARLAKDAMRWLVTRDPDRRGTIRNDLQIWASLLFTWWPWRR